MKILSDLVRKNVAEFSDKFFHFQYTTRDMCKGALNNYSMLKLRFLISIYTFEMYSINVSHQYYTITQDTKPHSYSRIVPKCGQINVFYLLQLLLLRSLFSLRGKLKYIIIHFPYEISNDIIQSYQLSRWILPLLPLVAPNVD